MIEEKLILQVLAEQRFAEASAIASIMSMPSERLPII